LAANYPSKHGQEFKIAIIASWIIASAIILFLFLIPGIFYHHVLISISNFLQVPHQEPCPLCGMTEAFIAISKGKLAQAKELNPWSIKFYAVMLINESLAILVFIYIIGKFTKAKNLSRNTTDKRKVENADS